MFRPIWRARRGAICTRFDLRIFYYNEAQSRLAEQIRLPYIFSWLSWCIALGHCRTRHAMLHDYDCLIVSDILERRYREFCASGVKVQGVRWYQGNGVLEEDQLATTFEAILDVDWVRSYPPIRLMNELKIRQGRSIDYDTLLDLQHNDLTPAQRQRFPMTLDDFVHPSQMVHQYTMFRRNPGQALPCFSIPMIPFFEYIAVGESRLDRAVAQIRNRREHSKTFPFLADNLLINFSLLDTGMVDWCLKQMVQGCIKLEIEPFSGLYEYGTELYQLVETPDPLVWKGDFNPEQRSWIERSASKLVPTLGN